MGGVFSAGLSPGPFDTVALKDARNRHKHVTNQC